MPEYLAPGVYVEETSFRPKTIEGVSTSTAGFVGPARFGPTSGEPRLLTSFADFQRTYGGLEGLNFDGPQSRTNYLAYAIRAFFEEGGQRCYVARVFSELDADTTSLNQSGKADGTTGDLAIEARYPGEAGNMRVLFRATPSRDVSRKDRTPSDDTGELPGVSLGDTVFADPGVGTPLESGGAGTNFYDYVLDDAGDRVLKNGSAEVKAATLKGADQVFPLQVRVLVQQALKRPGGGVEFGPENELGTYNFRPGSAEALVDALGAKDPSGDPTRTPIAVPPLTDAQGNPETAGTRYASEIFGAPMTGELLFPVTVTNLSNVQDYRFDVSFDPSQVTFSGVENNGDTLTPASKDVTFRRSGIHVQKDIVGALGGDTTLLNLIVTLRDDLGSQASLPIQDFALLGENGNPTSGPSLDQSTLTVSTGSQGDEKALAVELDADPGGQGVFSYRFSVPFDASKFEIDIDKQGTLTPPADPVRVRANRMFVQAEGLQPTLNGTDPLLKMRGRFQAPGSPPLTFDRFETRTDAQNAAWQDVQSDASIMLPEVEPGDLAPTAIRLSGGNDGKEPTSYVTSVDGSGPPDDPEGFDALEDLENVSIVAAPGYTAISSGPARVNVQDQLITHCTDMRYRIAVLDTPKNATVKEARDWRGNIDSKYAAMYYPWITIFDPLSRSELNVPPSGHVAGIYARNDIENGVHKAPANEVVRSAVGFETRINKAQQDVLNPEGVNCFRFFEGRGNRLWGARMATSDNEYKYVNIRRYLAYLERSIDEGTQVFVFENNGSDLWRNVRRTIGSFLKNEWRSNRLMGTTPEQAYFVRCDRSTMTQNDIDNGRLICEIGVALFRPAEFVIFRVGQKLLSDTG
ncbi:MAG: phage tail sheath subtilisin-like domain-containing protein [Salinivenus sp.]